MCHGLSCIMKSRAAFFPSRMCSSFSFLLAHCVRAAYSCCHVASCSGTRLGYPAVSASAQVTFMLFDNNDPQMKEW